MVDVLSPTTIQNLIQAYGLWVVFAVVMLEGTGIPVPGETALITAALYAGSTHQIGIASVVLVAAMAANVSGAPLVLRVRAKSRHWDMGQTWANVRV
jgi:membrane protein DedA with SNARE-associated domain